VRRNFRGHTGSGGGKWLSTILDLYLPSLTSVSLLRCHRCEIYDIIFAMGSGGVREPVVPCERGITCMESLSSMLLAM